MKFLSNTITFFMLCMFIALTVGCIKPPMVDVYETIETNETAYLVPLEGESKGNQKAFMSIDFLEEAKIATKRVLIPQKEMKVGRFDHEIVWIPTMRVIKVDRTPITRELTDGSDSGTSPGKQAIQVESKDSIGFSIGVNVTTMIKEGIDTSKFLYYYAGKSLAHITDTNVRGKISAILSGEFGKRDLTKCKTDKLEICDILEKELTESFVEFGITIVNIGLVGGLQYDTVGIQKAIDDNYVAEMLIQKSINEMEAQKEINKKTLSIAVTDREAAEEFAKAYDSMVKKMELDIEMKKAEATLVAANKWSGSLPASVIPDGSKFLFGLGTK